MTALGTQILTGLQVLAMPVNLIAVIAGTLLGALLGAMFRQLGVSGAAALVLLMPAATLLEPTTGLALLGACLTAALIAMARHDPEATLVHHHHGIALMALLAGLAIMLASASAAALLQSLAPADTIALLVCGAAAAIILAAATHPAGWPAAIGLTVVGIALQFTPHAPLNLEQSSPVPLLFGLLVVGPSLVALVMPQRITPWSTAFGGVELAATVLPAFLIGVPTARGTSVFALDLAEAGLSMGPRLMTQRPKLVLGFVLAVVAAGLLGAAGRLLTTRFARPSWLPGANAPLVTRAAAASILLLCIPALYLSGLAATGSAPSPLPVLAIATSVGAIFAWFGLELAPLVTGLVIGQLMQAPLRAAMSKAGGSLASALTSGSVALLLLALASILAIVVWPFLDRRAAT